MKYKFLRLKEDKIVSEYNNEFIWQIGKWYKEENISMCKRGFHCSKKPLGALNWVQGEVLAMVEARGKAIKDTDKECWEEMRILKAYRWTKKDSIALAIFSAELVIDNFEKEYPNDDRPRKAIEAAKKVLKRDTDINRSAAGLAAESAVWSAGLAARSAGSAARSAAGSAAESAAESAAWSAAWSAGSAARSAAWSAALNKINKWLIEHIKKLEPIKE